MHKSKKRNPIKQIKEEKEYLEKCSTIRVKKIIEYETKLRYTIWNYNKRKR